MITRHNAPIHHHSSIHPKPSVNPWSPRFDYEVEKADKLHEEAKIRCLPRRPFVARFVVLWGQCWGLVYCWQEILAKSFFFVGGGMIDGESVTIFC